jgi:hypothetical protein
MDCITTSNFSKNEGKQHQKERLTFPRPRKTGDEGEKLLETSCNMSYSGSRFLVLPIFLKKFHAQYFHQVRAKGMRQKL